MKKSNSNKKQSIFMIDKDTSPMEGESAVSFGISIEDAFEDFRREHGDCEGEEIKVYKLEFLGKLKIEKSKRNFKN